MQHSGAPRCLLRMRDFPLDVCMCYSSATIYCLASHQSSALPSILHISIARAVIDSYDGFPWNTWYAARTSPRLNTAAVSPSCRVALHVAPSAIGLTRRESLRRHGAPFQCRAGASRSFLCVTVAWLLPTAVI